MSITQGSYITAADFTYAHAEGENTTASGSNSHAEGYNTTASGVTAHAEGCDTIASGSSSHTEGYNTTASGDESHAEGRYTTASEDNSHAEGYRTTASGDESHAEGRRAIARGDKSHAEGDSTTASGDASHAEGDSTTASGDDSHAEGCYAIAGSSYAHAEGWYSLGANGRFYTITAFDNTAKTITLDTVSGLSAGDLLQISIDDNQALVNIPITLINGLIVTLNMTSEIDTDWKYAIKLAETQYPVHAEGYNTTASGAASHAEGYNTIANGDASHAEGFKTIASEYDAHAEGYNTTASGDDAHAEGYMTTASGDDSHAEGDSTTASGDDSHAEGDSTTASGGASHAEGDSTTAGGDDSHAEGYNTTASGRRSHAEGSYTTASGYYSHAGGYRNQSKYAQTAIGQYATVSSASDTAYDAGAEAFMIGNGTGTSSRGLAFKVLFNGRTYADGTYTSTGADYAEYFEWLDGNPDNEDRVGYFVTLYGDKIRKAASGDSYIIGIVSATPSVAGDNQDDHWQGKYLTDAWGRVQYHEVIISAESDSEGNIIIPEHKEIQPVYNPDWDTTIEYIPREKRKEWSAVGMMGKLFVRDDGSSVVNGSCMPNDNGIATNSASGYRVMKRVADNIIQVLFI